MDLLSAAEVRRLAVEHGFVESGSMKAYDVLLFSKTADPFPISLEAYLRTGDVAVYLPHPRQKAWRLFHFGALFSVETLRNVLEAPFSDCAFCYHLSEVITSKASSSPPPCPEHVALERQITLIDREVSDLQRERGELTRKLKNLGPNDEDDDCRSSYSKKMTTVMTDVRAPAHPSLSAFLENYGNYADQQTVTVASASVEDVRMTSVTSDMLMSRANGDRARGNKGVWSMFFPDAQEEFARAWTAKSVASVALGRGFVVSYDDGTATWSDVSPLLESKLRQQGVQTGSFNGKASVRIRYLVLGDEGNFYVKFDNGRMEWCGQDSFGAALRRGVSERHLLVEKVAFAQEGGWLIIWSDRTFEAENIPDTLEQRLGGTRVDDGRITGPASGIKDITLGPAGEWFVIYRDHSVQADNLPDGLYKCLSQIREKTGRVRSIAFGENRSWFVRYWDGTK